MADFVKFNKFLYQMGIKCYNLDSDTLKFALTDSAPTMETDTGFLPGSSHPPPSAANGYTTGGHTATIDGWSESGGTVTLECTTDLVIQATAGGIGPFRYVLLYDYTTTTPVLYPLIACWDYGSSITLANSGETFTIDVTASLFSLT